MAVTTHNVLVWLSALCHLAGAALSLRWSDLALASPGRWLAGAGVAVPGLAGLILWMAYSGQTPVFFVAGAGTTVIRQFVLSSTVAMFLLSAGLLREGNRARRFAFVAWYAPALEMLALGLFGAMLTQVLDSPLSWAARLTQYLAGGYMLVAALAAVRASGDHKLTLGQVRHHPLHTYGIAAAIVVSAAILRLVFMQGLGLRFSFVLFYPAVMLAALYAGFRAGLLATAVSALLSDYFWIEPAGSFAIQNPADLLGLGVFVLNGILISWVAEALHRAFARREVAEKEQGRLNRALRLLSDANQLLVRAGSEAQLLGDLCRLLVASGGYQMAWVGLARQDAAKSVSPVAYAGIEKGFLESLGLSWDGEQEMGRGSAGTAIRTGTLQVIQDCLSHPLWTPWRWFVLQRGFRSCISIPFISGRQVLGALTLHAPELHAFDAETQRLLEELAANMAYGLQSLRTRGDLGRHQQELEARVDARTAALARAGENTRLLIKHAPVSIAMFDRDMNYLAASDRWVAEYGRGHADLVGRNHYVLLPDIKDEWIDVHRQALAGATLKNDEDLWLQADGSEFWLRWAVLPWSDAGGEIGGIIISAENITEQKRANARLQDALRLAESATQAKSTFLATMSHEIRTPLNAVLGLTGLLADSPLDRRQRDYTDNIQLSAQALRSLIDDILDFSRIEAGALRLEQAPFSLGTILRTVAAVLSVGARGKSVEALIDVGQDVPDALVGDALRVQQVLLNLASNAVKFTAAGEILVEVRRIAEAGAGIALQFTVRDTGIGIPQEQQALIFEVFAQGDASTSRKYGGSGLGLAISRRLADLLGGRLELESVPGQGSEFRFCVPLGLADTPPAPPQADIPAGLRVLIVDDHPLSRDILGRGCAARGWQSTAVDGGAAGLAELRRSTAAGCEYDLLLLDWRMPGMDGIDMLRQARATPGTGLPLAVLMAAAFELEQAALASDEFHLDGLLAKPVTPASLHEAVASAYSGEYIGFVPALPRCDRRLAGMRLLVAEDNELNQQVSEQILHWAGAEVVLAAHGLEAVKALEAPGAHFDAVLMDIQMPVLDGYAAARVIREELGLVDLPIIAVTAYNQPEDREQSRRAGMAGHVVKPIDVDDLLDILEQGRRPPAQGAAGRPSAAPAFALPGLDLAGALALYGGDAQRFGELLRQFALRQGSAAEDAGRLFLAGDCAGAARLLHDLRGALSFLRAPDASRLAASAESALLAGGDAAPCFNDLRAAMATLLESIERFEAGSESP